MSSLRSLTYVQNHLRAWFFWLTPTWWRYVLLGPPEHWRRAGIWASWPAAAWCRATGHRAIVYYTHALATEPNTHCTGCGEDLG